jgi:polysaccharide biosynthesis transport protein
MAQPQFMEDVRRHLAVLHKRRALVLTSLGLSVLVAVLYNYSTRPLYQASAQILIDRVGPKVLPTSSNVDAGIQDFQTEYELIRGRTVTEKVVTRLELQKNQEMMKGPVLSPWERFQRRFLGKSEQPVMTGDGLPLSPAAAAVRSRLRVEPLPGGRLVNVRFTAYDPTLAATVPNAVAEEYIQQALNYRFTRSSEATGWLGERLEEQKRKVEEAEKALLDYQAQNGLATGGDTAPDDGVASLSTAVLAARMDRMAKENALAQVKALPPAQAATLPSIAGHPMVQDARTKLAVLQAEQVRLGETVGEKHPDMLRLKAEIVAAQDKLQTDVKNALRALESEHQAARAHELGLEQNLEQARRQGLEVGRKSIEYHALKREVETNKQLFQTLMSRSKETGLESELRTTNVRIVERAEPPRGPISPNRPENYRIALLVGLTLGVFLAFLFEHADSSLKTPEDVKEMGLPFLGMVPAVAPTAGAPANIPQKPASLRNPEGAVAEAYRILRTNLLFTCPGDSGRVLVFTSANPGEGKTTTSANVAGALALNGAKVLVVDADLRRPTMHQHFGASKTPGLSDVIVGKAQPSDVIQNTRFKGVFLLPCGYIAPNPTELLGSPAMRDLLKALKTRFDWVIVDTPPVLAMADTPVLAQFVDGVVLVLAAEGTTRPSIQRSMDQLTSVGGRILGAVLNKVDLRRNSYYYSHYYGEYYRSYYAEATAPARVAAGPRRVRR